MELEHRKKPYVMPYESRVEIKAILGLYENKLEKIQLRIIKKRSEILYFVKIIMKKNKK